MRQAVTTLSQLRRTCRGVELRFQDTSHPRGNQEWEGLCLHPATKPGFRASDCLRVCFRGAWSEVRGGRGGTGTRHLTWTGISGGKSARTEGGKVNGVELSEVPTKGGERGRRKQKKERRALCKGRSPQSSNLNRMHTSNTSKHSPNATKEEGRGRERVGHNKSKGRPPPNT